MQSSARELGFPGKALHKLKDFTCQEGKTYLQDPRAPGAIILVPSGDGPEVLFSGVSLGRQVITKNAPVAFVGGDGGLLEVTPLVKGFRVK